MVSQGYEAVRRNPKGCGIKTLPCGVIRLLGRDRQSFLQGQVTNDLLRLMPGQGAHACLLNNTGHLLADLHIYVFPDHLLLETDPTRARIVCETLDRFLVREKVMIEDSTAQWKIISVQGQGALDAIKGIVASAVSLTFTGALSHVPITPVFGGVEAFVVQRARTAGAPSYDLWLPAQFAEEAVNALMAGTGAVELDEETFDLLRIEAGIPRWG